MLLKIKETFFPPPATHPDTLKTNQVFDAIVSGNPSFLAQFPIQEIKDFTFTNVSNLLNDQVLMINA